MIWIFNFFFSAGIGPLSWAVPVEILNTSVRAKGTALTSMSCWVANFMIGQITPKALASVGWKYYILFAVGGFTNALTFWLILPETKGRTLEEMDQFFEQTLGSSPSTTRAMSRTRSARRSFDEVSSTSPVPSPISTRPTAATRSTVFRPAATITISRSTDWRSRSHDTCFVLLECFVCHEMQCTWSLFPQRL